MNPTITRATRDDVRQALAHISRQSSDELAAMGFLPAEAMDGFERNADRGAAYVSKIDDGVPLTLFGFNEFDDHFSMWSIGTTRFFEAGAPGVRATRRFFRGLALPKPVAVVTKAPHPDVDRWLRLLGLRFSGEVAGSRVYWLDCRPVVG